MYCNVISPNLSKIEHLWQFLKVTVKFTQVIKISYFVVGHGHEGSSHHGGGGLSRLLSVGSRSGREVPSLAVPKLSVCADSHKVDRSKLAQTEVEIPSCTYVVKS
jgi:hypothetical protein